MSNKKTIKAKENISIDSRLCLLESNNYMNNIDNLNRVCL